MPRDRTAIFVQLCTEPHAPSVAAPMMRVRVVTAAYDIESLLQDALCGSSEVVVVKSVENRKGD